MTLSSQCGNHRAQSRRRRFPEGPRTENRRHRAGDGGVQSWQDVATGRGRPGGTV